MVVGVEDRQGRQIALGLGGVHVGEVHGDGDACIGGGPPEDEERVRMCSGGGLVVSQLLAHSNKYYMNYLKLLWILYWPHLPPSSRLVLRD